MNSPKLSTVAAHCRATYGTGIKDTLDGFRRDGNSLALTAALLGITVVTLRAWCKIYGIAFDRATYRKECCGGHYAQSWTPQRRLNVIRKQLARSGAALHDPELLYRAEVLAGIRRAA